MPLKVISSFLLLFVMLFINVCNAEYQHNFVFVNKSYGKELKLSLRLYESIEKFVMPKNIPFYVVTPVQDSGAFKEAFNQAKADGKIKNQPIFLTDDEVFKGCGSRIYEKARKENGYFGQQIVKMCFGKLNIARYYMTIDSDTYFTKFFYTEMLFNDGMVKTYAGAPATFPPKTHNSLMKVKKIVRDKSKETIYFVNAFGLWSSKLLRQLEVFTGHDYVDLINIDSGEMQWYGNFVYAQHKDLFHPIDPLFTLMQYYYTPEDEYDLCIPSKGHPWTYGITNYRKEVIYTNPCNVLRTFIVRFTGHPKKYFRWWFKNFF